jgi:hypothetical protein
MVGAIRNILVQHFVDLGGDWRDTVFLTGAGRGGTTWLAELMNYRNDWRYIFEPFYAGEVADAAPFANWQYVAPGDPAPLLAGYADDVVTGKTRHQRVDMFNRKLFSTRRLIKEVRANLMVGWLADRYPGMRIVLLLRHPLATIRSRLAHNREMDLDGQFLNQPALVRDYLADKMDVIRAARTDFERHVAAWCIEHCVALTQLRGRPCHVTYYERLSVDPERELASVLRYAGIPFEAKRARKSMRKPSATAHDSASAISSGTHAIDAWRNTFEAGQIRFALEVLERFGLGGIYSDAAMPNSAAVDALLATA